MTPVGAGAGGQLGGEPGRVLLVGCEPADVSPGMGLSAPVAEAVDAAAELVRELVDQQIAAELAPASHEEEPAW